MICPPSPPILGGTGKSHSPPELGDLGGNAESAVFTDSFPDSATPGSYTVEGFQSGFGYPARIEFMCFAEKSTMVG